MIHSIHTNGFLVLENKVDICRYTTIINFYHKLLFQVNLLHIIKQQKKV